MFKREGSQGFKLKKNPKQQHAVFQEMSINMDLYNDRLPTNEEIIGRQMSGDKMATDRTASFDEPTARTTKKF